MPGDVFAALEDIEFPFFRERLEAEFKSAFIRLHCHSREYHLEATPC